MRETIWISYTYKVFMFVKCNFFCFAEGRGDWMLWPGCLYSSTGKLSTLGTLTSSISNMWLCEYDTSAEDSLTKSEGFSCIIEAHVVPSVALCLITFYSRTSAIKKAALCSILLKWDYQNLFLTSSSRLPPWSAELYQVFYLVLIDGHTLLECSFS